MRPKPWISFDPCPSKRSSREAAGRPCSFDKKAESILRGPWVGGERENLAFLDPSHLERVEGILKKRPVHYRNGISR